VNKLQEYFHTDWAAMTLHDWIGLLLTVTVFLALIYVYAYVLHPKNREKLESQRRLPDDEEPDSEDKK